MKKVVIILLIFTINGMYAQKKGKHFFEPDTSKVNEFEVDVTNVLKTAVTIGDYGNFVTSIGSPYLITYRRYLGNDFDIHTGIGISGTKSEYTSNDSTFYNNSNLIINYGVGFSHYSNIGKKIKLTYGLDAVYRYSMTKYENLNQGAKVNRNSKNHSIGGAPFLGIQFYVHPKISLTTQTSFNVLYNFGESTYTRVDENAPMSDINEVTKVKGVSSRYSLPLNIQLRVRF